MPNEVMSSTGASPVAAGRSPSRCSPRALPPGPSRRRGALLRRACPGGMTIHPRRPTATSTIVIVSFPKISTTFTAIFTRFFSTSFAALRSSNLRSFFVRKLCRSFSKMKSPVHTSSHSSRFFCSPFIPGSRPCEAGSTSRFTRMISRLFSKSKSTDQ